MFDNRFRKIKIASYLWYILMFIMRIGCFVSYTAWQPATANHPPCAANRPPNACWRWHLVRCFYCVWRKINWKRFFPSCPWKLYPTADMYVLTEAIGQDTGHIIKSICMRNIVASKLNQLQTWIFHWCSTRKSFSILTQSQTNGQSIINGQVCVCVFKHF